jgi:hypothetical protein
VTCEVDDVFHPPVGHYQHNLNVKLGFTHTDIILRNMLLVEHMYSLYNLEYTQKAKIIIFYTCMYSINTKSL